MTSQVRNLRCRSIVNLCATLSPLYTGHSVDDSLYTATNVGSPILFPNGALFL